MVSKPQRQSTNPSTYRACLALRPAIPCVTLSPCGAQAGVMPTDGALLAAADAGKAEEVQTLIMAGATIEENDPVSDGARAGIGRFLCCWFCFETRSSGVRL